MAITVSQIIPISVGLATIVIGILVVNYFRKGKKSTEDKKPLISKSESSSTKPNLPKLDVTTTDPSGSRPSTELATPHISKFTPSGYLRTLCDPNEKYMLPLIEKIELSHDTFKYRFGLTTEYHVLGLPIGQHVHLVATINDELIVRAYTPVSCDDDQGYVDLVIKVYKRNVHPKFPDGGKMSQFVDALKVGDKIAFKGPTGKLQYLGNGKFSIKKLRKDPAQTVSANTVNMIAGGTGITPMLQLVRDILKKPADTTKLALLYANQTESDILLRKELDDLARKYSEQFKVWYTLDTVGENWKYSKGFVSEEMISSHLYPPSDKTICLMCGPPPMINFACQPNLEKLGHAANMRFAY